MGEGEGIPSSSASHSAFYQNFIPRDSPLRKKKRLGEKNGRSKCKELRDRLNYWLLYKSNSQLHVTQGTKSWEDATTAESPDTGSANARRRSYVHRAPNAMSSAIGEKTACRAKGPLPVKPPQPILALN